MTIVYPDDICMDFFERIKILVRQRTHDTLRGFIESLGMNYETYYSGKRIGKLPRADDAYKIAKALDVSVEYLLTGLEVNPEKEELRRLKATLRELAK